MLQEYASLVGKSVKQLADAKYEPPEESESEEVDLHIIPLQG